MDRGNFVKKLYGLSKPCCESVIKAAGLKAKEERILLFWYIQEKSIAQIASTENLQMESAYNAIAKARSRLYEILTQQAKLLPADVQKIIEYLVS